MTKRKWKKEFRRYMKQRVRKITRKDLKVYADANCENGYEKSDTIVDVYSVVDDEIGCWSD